MEVYAYTAADLEVERGVADWGSPQATVTVKVGPLAGEIYRLRSPKGLTVDGIELDPEHDHYMLDLIRNRHGQEVRDVVGWYGSYPTDDLDTALGYLPETLTEWVADEADRWQLDSVLYELREAIGDASSYDTRRSRHSLRERWPRVRQLMIAAEMQLYPKPEWAPLPPPPRWSFQAPLLRIDVETVDRRVLAAGHDYDLSAPEIPLYRRSKGHSTTMVGMVFRIWRRDGLVWAYGWTTDAATAARLATGELVLSASVDCDNLEHTGGLKMFHGGKVSNAYVVPADDNPWGSWQ